MPLNILKKEEQSMLIKNAKLPSINSLPAYIGEDLRAYLPLRVTREIISTGQEYKRRARATRATIQPTLFDLN